MTEGNSLPGSATPTPDAGGPSGFLAGALAFAAQGSHLFEFTAFLSGFPEAGRDLVTNFPELRGYSILRPSHKAISSGVPIRGAFRPSRRQISEITLRLRSRDKSPLSQLTKASAPTASIGDMQYVCNAVRAPIRHPENFVAKGEDVRCLGNH